MFHNCAQRRVRKFCKHIFYRYTCATTFLRIRACATSAVAGDSPGFLIQLNSPSYKKRRHCAKSGSVLTCPDFKDYTVGWVIVILLCIVLVCTCGYAIWIDKRKKPVIGQLEVIQSQEDINLLPVKNKKILI